MKPLLIITANWTPEFIMRAESYIEKRLNNQYLFLIIPGKELKIQMFSTEELTPIDLAELKAMFKNDSE